MPSPPCVSVSGLYVAGLTPSIFVYAPGADGTVAPIRTISGSNTGLGSLAGVAVDAGGNLYVANSGFPPSINVYAPDANGNVAPIRTIAGSNTGFLATGVGFITVL